MKDEGKRETRRDGLRDRFLGGLLTGEMSSCTSGALSNSSWTSVEGANASARERSNSESPRRKAGRRVVGEEARERKDGGGELGVGSLAGEVVGLTKESSSSCSATCWRILSAWFGLAVRQETRTYRLVALEAHCHLPLATRREVDRPGR